MFGWEQVHVGWGEALMSSTDRKDSPSYKKTKSKFLQKIESGEIVENQPEDYKNPSELPRWVKMVVAKHELLGLSWREAAEECKKSAGSLSRYKKSVAFDVWEGQLRAIADDPMRLAQLVLKSSLMESALDYLGVIESAKDVNDYKEIRLATKDLLKTYELLKDERSNKGASGPIVVQVNLGNMSVEVPEVEAEYEVLIDEEPDAGTA